MADTNAPIPEGRLGPDEATVFVLGNGPSLADVDLQRLDGFATIGMNAAYRHWHEIDWRPTHYACLDTIVGLSHRDAIAGLIEEGQIEHFLLRSNLIADLGSVARTRRVVNFDALSAGQPLFGDPGVTTGAGAALWGAHLGFKTIVILGVDGRYTEIVDGAERRSGNELEIVRDASNPNYFFSGYQRAGDRYNVPNPRPDLHVGSWRAAGTKLRDLPLRVYNGAPNSAVRVFPFIELRAFLGGTATPVDADEALPELQKPEGNHNRMSSFLNRYRLPLALSAILLAALTVAAIGFARPVVAAAIIGLGLGLAGLTAFTLYFRMAAIDQINRQSQQIIALEARLLDAERLAGADD